MAQYVVVADYYACAASDVVEFPDDKTWDDVVDYYIKWDRLNVQFKGSEEWLTFDLNSDANESIDWKRPSEYQIHPVVDDETDYGVDLSEEQ